MFDSNSKFVPTFTFIVKNIELTHFQGDKKVGQGANTETGV